MKMTMPLARKIYWNLSLVGLAIVWGGMWRRHRGHAAHSSVCRCMTNCLVCGFEALRGKDDIAD